MQPSFDLLNKSRQGSLPRQLAKRGVQFAAGAQLVAISKRMGEIKKNMDNEPVEEEDDTNYEFEFVFHEEAILSFRKVTLSLVEKLLRNGIAIDQETIDAAKEHVDLFDYLIKQKEKEENGN